MAEGLISNQITCACGAQSPLSPDWWTVQNWWKRHAYGTKCGGRMVEGEERDGIILR